MGDIPKDIKEKIQQEQEKIKNQYIGQSFAKVEQDLKTKSISYRVVKIDKNYFIVTRDVQIHRVNIEVENETVSKIYFG